MKTSLLFFNVVQIVVGCSRREEDYRTTTTTIRPRDSLDETIFYSPCIISLEIFLHNLPNSTTQVRGVCANPAIPEKICCEMPYETEVVRTWDSNEARWTEDHYYLTNSCKRGYCCVDKERWIRDASVPQKSGNTCKPGGT
ncbi:uncharacterized protein LOC110855394 [Folsomia candida]|uniref:Uncharacterized protein n=1 Tax=Folsomia candida TaxID=158441 RepID=A0A226DTK4_FOLCA|nr:uncharacterized protein LOC110855394 [Folsomia candida]OXA48164.1 hypothetical protein Fcan01_16883 [Folsomia candida]